MHIRWFGEPWNNTLCAETEYQIPAPVESKCIECTRPIEEKDRGVVTACSPSIWGSWDLLVDNQSRSVCSYHLLCFLEQVVGGEPSYRVRQRMNFKVTDDFAKEKESFVEPERGRGWRDRDDS